MKVESYREGGRIWVRPLDKKDLPLFKHCSGGMISVVTEAFNVETKPLLFIHGIGSITHIDNT